MIKQLHPGDTQISAAGWNEMRAAVQGLTPGQQQYQSGQRCAAYVTIRNQTGYDLPAFSVVKIDGAAYSRSGDEFKNQAIKNGIELNGYTPTSNTDTVAITQAACEAGGLVKAMVSGATACIINKAANKAYKYAAPVANQRGYLTGSDTVTNIRVLWVDAGTGNEEAYVLLTSNALTLASVTVYGTIGVGTVYADIGGVQYEVILPNANAGLSAPNYPDIYPGDEILVILDNDSGLCYGVDYPTDYESGTLMAFYSGQGSPGRGWDAIATAQAMTDAGFTLYQKVKTGAIL